MNIRNIVAKSILITSVAVAATASTFLLPGLAEAATAPQGSQVVSMLPAAQSGPAVTKGEKLNWSMFAAWDVPGTKSDFVSLGSGGYYYYDENVYTTWIQPYCGNIIAGAIDFICGSGARWGVIGNGTSHVNPWYNQPVEVVVAAPDPSDPEFPVPGVYFMTIYCRTNFYSTGSYNNTCFHGSVTSD
jgi:hypothetical protein